MAMGPGSKKLLLAKRGRECGAVCRGGGSGGALIAVNIRNRGSEKHVCSEHGSLRQPEESYSNTAHADTNYTHAALTEDTSQFVYMYLGAICRNVSERHQHAALSIFQRRHRAELDEIALGYAMLL